MKLVLTAILLLILTTSFSQIKLKKLSKASLSAFKYEGTFVEAAEWNEAAIVYTVILSETGPNNSKKSSADNRDAAIYAYLYSKNKDSLKLNWKVQDFVRDCPVDVEANFIKNAFKITDLNKDGNAEVWLMYKTACRGGVDPAELKIIMYENNKKYAMRGTTRIKGGPDDYTGGKYVFDEAFKNSNALFRQFAQQLWKNNMNEFN